MVFNSIVFLIFILIFFPSYWLLRGRARMWLCLIASYIFYGWWDWRFLSIVMFTTILDYSLGIVIEDAHNEAQRKRLVFLSVCVNLGFLGFFKYFNFFVGSFVKVLASAGMQPNWHTLHIILPIGISFYTFQSMSYTIDVFRKEIKAERDFWRYATFVSFFPQLVAGPIVRARQFLPQFQSGDKVFDWRRFIEGLSQVLWGFFKKVAIADSIAPYVDQIFALPTNFSSLSCLIGVVLYSFQIYCDFSGYSNIACGLAQMLGFDFPWNFRTPYFSKNFSEFWTRWHISLSSWLRDYLYISLGGNRGGKWMTYRNLMLTMIIGGLWHGANWTFVFWGFLHGSYLVVQRLISHPLIKLEHFLRLPTWFISAYSIAVVYFFTCLAWVYFRAVDFKTASQVISQITHFEGFSWHTVLDKLIVMKAVVLITILLVAEICHNNFKNLQALAIENPVFRIAAFATLLMLTAFFGTFSASAFIYFQF
jgi:D-alanyl-lipoteichoic acid acyltransferase DltB (MBOAT superfamily)